MIASTESFEICINSSTSYYRYDILLPDFPSPEMCQVCLLSEHDLLEVNTDAVLHWRHTGDEWEISDGFDPGEDLIPGFFSDALEAFQAGKLDSVAVLLRCEKKHECEGVAREVGWILMFFFFGLCLE
jgi:hypothetical protein